MENQVRGKCYDCYRPKKNCLCKILEPFETTFKFVLLMHPKEAKKQPLGTGRLTNKALLNCEIIIDKTFDKNTKVQEYLQNPLYQPYLLYPGKNAHNLSKEPYKLSHKIPLLFILDGTWPCAKSMLRDSPTLHNIPRLSFQSETISRFKIKQQPAKYCLSTIESVYEVLTLLEKQKIENTNGRKERLLFALDAMVEFQIKCANDPNLVSYKRKKPYKGIEERKPSLKWQERSVCFLD